MTTNGNGNRPETKYGKTILEERRQTTPNAVAVLETVVQGLGLDFYDQEAKTVGIRSVDAYLVMLEQGAADEYPDGAPRLLFDVLYTTKEAWGEGYEAHTESVSKALASHFLGYFKAYGMRLDPDQAAERLGRAGTYEEFRIAVNKLAIEDKAERYMRAINQFLAPDFCRVVSGKKLERDISCGLNQEVTPFSRDVINLVSAAF
jgi:hypothetical protein